MNLIRLEKLKEWELQKPEDAFLKFAIAVEYVSIGDDETARKYLEVLATEFPDYLATYYQLGKLYERVGEEEKAVNTYQAGIQVAKVQQEHKTFRELNEAFMILKNE